MEAQAARLFALSIALALCGLASVAFALGSGVDAVRLEHGRAATHLALFGQRFSYPNVNLAAVIVLALALVGAAVVSLGLRAAAGELRASRRFLRAMDRRDPRPLGDVFIFEDAEAQAFCAGLLSPRVYLSSSAWQLLPAEELAAVLAHERHHRERRDPLRIAVGRVLARALFFMPALERLHERYCALAELAADDAAIRADRGDPRALAAAMLAFGDASHPAGAVGIAPERVENMLGRTVSWSLPAALIGAALAISALVAALSWQVGRLALAQATFALPFLSTQPCIVVLALMPGLLGAAAIAYLRR